MSVLKAQLLFIFFSLMIKAADRHDTHLVPYELLDGSLVTCASSICVRGKQLGCDPEKVLDQCTALRGLQYSHEEMRSAMPLENRERFESFFTVLQTAYLIKEKKISEIESYALLKKLGLEKLFTGASDVNKCGAIHARDMCIDLLGQKKCIKKMIKSPKDIFDLENWVGDWVRSLVAEKMYHRLAKADIFKKHIPTVSGDLLPTCQGVRLYAADNGDYLALYPFIGISEAQFYSDVGRRRTIIGSEFLAYNTKCVVAYSKTGAYTILSSSGTTREIKTARYDGKAIYPVRYMVSPERIHLLSHVHGPTCDQIIIATKKNTIYAYDMVANRWSEPYEIHTVDGITALDTQFVGGVPLIYVGDQNGILCIVAYDVTNAQFSLEDIHVSKRGNVCYIAHNNEPLPLVLYAHSVGDLSIVNRDIKEKKYQLHHAALGNDVCSLAVHPVHSDLVASGHSDAIALWSIDSQGCMPLWRLSLESRERELKDICWAGVEHLSFSRNDDNCLYKVDMRDLYRFSSYAHENQNNMLIMLALHALQRKKNKNKHASHDVNLKKILAMVPDEIKSFLDT